MVQGACRPFAKRLHAPHLIDGWRGRDSLVWFGALPTATNLTSFDRFLGGRSWACETGLGRSATTGTLEPGRRLRWIVALAQRRWLSCNRYLRKMRPVVHGTLTDRSFTRLFFLKHVPVLDKDSIPNPDDVCGDPARGAAEPGKSSVHNDEVVFRHNDFGFIFQRRRTTLNHIEEPVATGFNMRTVLDIVG